MMPPSTQEIMNSVGSKYAVVIGISKKARLMAINKELEEKEGRLSDMINHTLENLIANKLTIYHTAPQDAAEEETEAIIQQDEAMQPETETQEE